MPLVRLKFKSVSEIVGTEDVGLLLLVTEDEQRQLSIVCDKAMIYQFGLRLSHTPVTDKLLPEVLWTVVKRHTELNFQVIINDLIDGQYRTLLYEPNILQAIPVRASDGVLLANIAELPIYIEERLLLRQSVPHDGKSSGVAVPVNVISDEMLVKALRKAVDEENYEQASQLRDELRRRGKDDLR